MLNQEQTVNSIHFNPVSPHEFAVTSGSQVDIFDPYTNEVRKTIGRFNKSTAYSGRFRSDGQLLVAGAEDHSVKIFDLSSRAILRTLQGHEGPVHTTLFSSNKCHIMSASDDKTVRCWDLAMAETLSIMKGHTDLVRCGDIGDSSPDVWITGSYDHTVKLWDIKSGETINTFDHGDPVEAVVVNPAGSLLFSAGGNYVKVWDLLKGGLVTSLESHLKTVTSLAFDAPRSRLYTGSLDQHVKAFKCDTFELAHSLKFTAPIISVSVSPAETHLVVGMADGMLAIRHKPPKKQAVHLQEEKLKRKKKAFTDENAATIVAPVTRKQRPLLGYENNLNNHEYKACLDKVLKKTKTPFVTINLFEELMKRGALENALAGRSELELTKILDFIHKYINHPLYSACVVRVFNHVLDYYAHVIGLSQTMDKKMNLILAAIDKEIEIEKSLLDTMGAIDLLLNANSATRFVRAPQI
uniref:U3 small nucleolar RNA-associated protein 15 C-terminal domain-containing protein n=1 Tax=Arcella intermedia TaxID=1963864 RepID=A0A6B2L3E6_9EUKA